MIIWIIRALIVIAGPLISYFQISRNPQGIMIGLLFSLGIVLAEIVVQRIPLDTIIAAVLGCVLGLIGAKLLDYTIYLMDNQMLNEIMKSYSLLIKVILAYFGLVIAVKKKSELDLLDRDILKKSSNLKGNELIILDTSTVIDGRISDIADTKFLYGILVVPRFILDELQSLSDSSDAHKRNRARRGLDVIAKLQKTDDITIKIFDKDFPDIPETDAKLLELAKELDSKIITTDFNLNKIAGLQGVVVLNINDLANALKPVYLPGETMPIFVVKEGKEPKQGVGYLDDGTMVVVEDGRKYTGKRIDVTVTSILQTSSGRMVFTHPVQDSHHHTGSHQQNNDGHHYRRKHG